MKNNGIIVRMEDREFQNLLAIRNQLVMLLIATTGGVVWLAQDPFINANLVFIVIGLFFIARIIISIQTNNKKISKMIKEK